MVDHVTPHRCVWTAFVTGKLQNLCEPFHRSAKRQIELRGYRSDIGLDGAADRVAIPRDVAGWPMVGWFEAVDDWGENVALTRSRHLIDGSLSVDSFLCRVDGGDGSPGPTSDSRAAKRSSGISFA